MDMVATILVVDMVVTILVVVVDMVATILAAAVNMVDTMLAVATEVVLLLVTMTDKSTKMIGPTSMGNKLLGNSKGEKYVLFERLLLFHICTENHDIILL